MWRNKRYERSGCTNGGVPSFLPKILSQWFEAAVRTRPTDLRRWSEMYFRMKANGEHPPVKPYIDTPGRASAPGGLNPSVLKALATTLANEFERSGTVERTWDMLSLDRNTFLGIMRIGKFGEAVRPTEFIGIAAAHLNDRLRDTMILVCDTYSKPDRDGVALDRFVSVYRYLARLDCVDVAPTTPPPPAKYVMLATDEQTETPATNAADDDGCPSGTDSHASSDLDGEETHCPGAVGPTERDDIPGTERAIGGVTVTGNNRPIISDERTTQPFGGGGVLCGDPDYLLSLTKLNERASNDELLSLLSGSSVLSEPGSCASAACDVPQPDGATSPVSPRDVDYGDVDRSDENRQTDGGGGDYTGPGGNDEETAYDEDNCVDTEPYEYNDDGGGEDDDVGDETAAAENREYVVMTAVVDYGNGPSPDAVTVDEPARPPAEDGSTGSSEFSLLDRVALDDDDPVVRRTGDNGPPRRETYDEDDHYANFGEYETSSGGDVDSDETRCSEFDRRSDDSEGSIPLEGAGTTEAYDSATDRHKLSLDDDGDGHSFSAEFEFRYADETETEQNAVCEFDWCTELGRTFEIEWTAGEENGRNPDTPVVVEEEEQQEEVEEKVEEEEQQQEEEQTASYVAVLAGVGPTVPEKQIDNVVRWVTGMAELQHGYVYGHNLLHFLCPALDLKSKTCGHRPETI